MATPGKKKTDSERQASESRSQERKRANEAKNQMKHQANLDYIKEHGLTGFTIEKTVTVRTKLKDTVVEREKIVSRPAAAGTIVQRHKNSLDNTRHLAWLEAQKGSPLPAEYSTAKHLRAKKEAERQRRLSQIGDLAS